MKKLMVIDGNSIVNRAFYGVRPLTTRDGLYTNAVYGFVTMLQKLLEEEKPEALCGPWSMRATKPSGKGCRRNWRSRCRY